MGMVLPEGVLNTLNLQKVREYFEGKAKIILICSIPQDVFIAAGATVKPSLVFLKRFTEKEEKDYLTAKEKAESKIREKYTDDLLRLKAIADNGDTKTKRTLALKKIEKTEKQIVEEAKPLLKEYFDYEIPVAMVEDAGITSTGAVSQGNQLPILQEEYKNYRTTNKLWTSSNTSIFYTIKSSGDIVRNLGEKEIVLKW